MWFVVLLTVFVVWSFPVLFRREECSRSFLSSSPKASCSFSESHRHDVTTGLPAPRFPGLSLLLVLLGLSCPAEILLLAVSPRVISSERHTAPGPADHAAGTPTSGWNLQEPARSPQVPVTGPRPGYWETGSSANSCLLSWSPHTDAETMSVSGRSFLACLNFEVHGDGQLSSSFVERVWGYPGYLMLRLRTYTIAVIFPKLNPCEISITEEILITIISWWLSQKL